MTALSGLLMQRRRLVVGFTLYQASTRHLRPSLGCAGDGARLFVGHEIGTQAAAHAHRLQVWLPHLQLLLGVIQHLAGVVGVGEGLADIAWDNGCVVKVIE